VLLLSVSPAVFVVKVDPNYAQPWQKCPQRSSSGSAFVLDTEQRIIITNAHVVRKGTHAYGIDQHYFQQCSAAAAAACNRCLLHC
jgi:S1-C subfamily serine protease